MQVSLINCTHATDYTCEQCSIVVLYNIKTSLSTVHNTLITIVYQELHDIVHVHSL